MARGKLADGVWQVLSRDLQSQTKETMADPVLHIKDSFYFEVPKVLYPYEYTSRKQFDDTWISLDPEYQDWEAKRLYMSLKARNADLPPQEKAIDDWHHFVHADHKNFAKPLKEFLEEKYQSHVTRFKAQLAAEKQSRAKAPEGEKTSELDFEKYLEQRVAAHDADAGYVPFLKWRHAKANEFAAAKQEARNIREWKEDDHIAEWAPEKIKAYNGHLSGKILIPQPLATLRNLYEAESGFAISKYLLIEVFVGLVLIVLFSRFAKQIELGKPPKGMFANLLEVFLVFIRDQIARPVLGSHDHGHEDHGDHATVETHVAADAHGHGPQPHGHGDVSHGHGAAARAHHHDHAADPASRFLPLLWTIFFFVLGCNLMGMVPWAGAPTAAFAVTFALACVTFFTVVVAGMMQFGVAGFFLNQIPGMDLPWYMAIVLKPAILLIELLGLMIKHGVLAVRLLANMVAGHLVLLGVMGLAFGAEAAMKFSSPEVAGWQWYLTAAIAVLGSAAFSCLELFVAFLQAYIFTFLSALFIGASIHKH
jgi:F-type H+-transporting ATPase subunit a